MISKLLHFAIFFLSLLLIGCGNSKKGNMKGKKELYIIPQNNINQGMALSMCIVQCYDQDLLQEFHSMNADEFFTKKHQLARNYPDKIKIWDVHIEQNSLPLCIVIPSKKRYWGIVLYFNFTPDTAEKKYIFSEQTKSIEFLLKDCQFFVSHNKKKYVYSPLKSHQWLCVYLDFNNCLGEDFITQMKTKIK